MSSQEPPYGHESPGVADRRIFRIGAIIIAALVIAAAAIHFALRLVVPRHAQVVARISTVPPQPRLEVDRGRELATFQARKHQLLATWSWTDASHDFARIPIDRALVIYQRQQAARAQAPSQPGRTP